MKVLVNPYSQSEKIVYYTLFYYILLYIITSYVYNLCIFFAGVTELTTMLEPKLVTDKTKNVDELLAEVDLRLEESTAFYAQKVAEDEDLKEQFDKRIKYAKIEFKKSVDCLANCLTNLV